MPDRLGADYWRERAQKARAQANDMGDPRASCALLAIAENYDQLAEQAEAIRKSRAALVEPSGKPHPHGIGERKREEVRS
jgi:hypothetical protein